MYIFCCTFAHVYILSHILHNRANALPYSSMATLLDHSTPMPSQHAFCAVRIYGARARASVHGHHALWLLVRAKAIACNRNYLLIALNPCCLQRIQDCTYQRLTPIIFFRFTQFSSTHNRHYQRPTTRPHLLHGRLRWFWRRRSYSVYPNLAPTTCQRWHYECAR